MTKRNLKVVGLFIFSSLCAAAAVAGGRYDEVTIEKFPDADAVIVDALEETEYFPDGTSTTVDEQWVKILTEKGRRDNEEIALHYSKRYGKASLKGVWITGADGVEREIDVSATTSEQTSNSSMKSNIYDPLERRIVATVPGLKIGDVMHIKVENGTFAARCQNQFADTTMLEWDVPILRTEVRLKSPKELPIKRIAISHPLGNVTSNEVVNADGSMLRTWVVTNSPQAFPEPNMPSMRNEIQNLYYSTAGSWEELSSWYWGLCEPHLATATEAITNKVHELKNDLRAIYDFVAQEVRYMGLTMEDTSPGYAPHDVCITFDNRYGVCRDKAALLVAMLRIAGFEAYPVLIHAGEKVYREVPMPWFNHAIVAVRAPGDARANADGFILMDPTDESSHDLLPAYLNDSSYLVACPMGETLHTTPVTPAASNLCRINSEVTVMPEGTATLDVEAAFGGVNDNAFRSSLLRVKPADRRKIFERMLQSLYPGCELTEFSLLPENLQDTTAPLSCRLSAKVSEVLLEGETRDELDLPMLSGAFGVVNWLLEDKTVLDHRRFPLTIESTAAVSETMRIRFDSGMRDPISLPPTTNIEGPYSFHSSAALEDDALVLKREIAINAVEIAPEDYLAMRENIKRVEAVSRVKPIFAKNPLANANVRYLVSSSEVDFTGPRSWVATNRIVKQVLTYDGKKRSGELKLSFNPTWEQIRVLNATVTSPNGLFTSEISEHEMNVMDCGWAARAPRYPASKQLIVSLPSVEVGSLISYTVETVVTDAPAPYYSTFYFDVTEPTDELSVRVGDWRRTVRNPRLVKTEPMTAPNSLWRDVKIFTHCSFEDGAAALREATDVDAVDPAVLELEGKADLKAIRDWMARHITIVGPALYEVPIARQLSDPLTVIKERYATRLDYVRTLAALFKGAGYDCDIVFATVDADMIEAIARRNMFECPNVRAFGDALCRVTVREGGFLWWGGTTTTYFIGTENEYAPLGATAYDRSHFFDPETAEFGVVAASDPALRPNLIDTTRISVRENGAVDMDVENLLYGLGVGSFRQRYIEMLPEDRSRHYQGMLSGLSQGATATSDLTTDTASYPARLAFSCMVPDFAVVGEDSVKLTIPDFGTQLFPLYGQKRQNPLGVAGGSRQENRYIITFPEGYTEIEHLPDGYAFHNPEKPSVNWFENTVATRVENGRLVVEVMRREFDFPEAMVGAGFDVLLKDWNRIGAAKANRTIIVRRPSAK